jgi:hypothetical protein
MNCLPEVIEGEHICSVCGWGKGQGRQRSFTRNCRSHKKEKNVQCLGLGDRVSQALSLVGITEERVSEWLGRPCGCSERREKLNQLGQWVARVLSGKTEQAEEHLQEMIDQ